MRDGGGAAGGELGDARGFARLHGLRDALEQRGAADVRLEATVRAATAAPAALRHDAHVADLRRHAAVSAQEPVVDDDAGADARADEHAQHVP